MNSKLHVVCDSRGRPIQMYLSAGQTSDYVGAAGLLRSMPRVNCLLADRGYDADWLCCTNPMRDSSCESSVVAGWYEQTHTPRLQDPELA